MPELPLCPICQTNPRKLKKNCVSVYLKTCCTAECRAEAIRRTNIIKYGHPNFTQSEYGKAKVQATLKQKYGEHITNISQIPEVKQKKQQTCMENFGVPWPMQSKEVRDKSIATVLEQYGVANISQVKSIIDQIQITRNTPNPITGKTPLQIAMETRIANNIKKFGKPHYFMTTEFLEKYKNTMLIRYGVDNIRKSKAFHDDMVSKGYRHSDIELTQWKRYKNKVTSLTRKTAIQNWDVLFEAYIGNDDFHLDHIFSISEGFKQNIPIEIIGSICNLQLLPAIVNLTKNTDCWITKDELYERYRLLTIPPVQLP